jgi:hypothetical protein
MPSSRPNIHVRRTETRCGCSMNEGKSLSVQYHLKNSIKLGRKKMLQDAESVIIISHSGPVAQRLEQWTHNPLVRGSNPRGPSYPIPMILKIYCVILSISEFYGFSVPGEGTDAPQLSGSLP